MFALFEKAVVLTAAFVLYGTVNTWKKKHMKEEEEEKNDSRTED